MRQTSPIAGRPALALRRVSGAVVDVLLWGAGVAALELYRPFMFGDGADLIALTCATCYGMLLAGGARAGLLPLTRWVGTRVERLWRRAVAALTPRYAVGFRRSADVRPLPDRAVHVLLGVFTGLAVLALLLGGRLRDALLFVKHEIAYTPYLLGLALLWAVLGGGLMLGFLSTIQWLQERIRAGNGTLARVGLSAAWCGGMIATVLLPGWVPVVVLLAVAYWTWRKFTDRVSTPYIFCRRDAQKRPRVIPVDRFLRAAFLTVTAAGLFVVALAQSDRMFQPTAPDGPFALTTALGMLATIATILLLAHVGGQFTRLLGTGSPPELPLTPTIWARPGHDTGRRWIEVAEAKGWRVAESAGVPPTGYDLVVGDASSPRRLEPRVDASRDDLAFQLDRRLAVVMRRRFWRGMQRLFKALRGAPRSEGSGFLFCPHVWLVRGVVRDVDPKDQGGTGSLIGPAYVGPFFDDVFPRRVRRYLGGVLRDLGVDIVYWEDAIRWPDLKRVLGVAFEIHDQRRSPLEERHFVGVPGIRVLLQVDHAETEPPPTGDYPTPAPGHMRVMIVLRDRGGNEAPITPAPPGGRRRTPVPTSGA